MKIILFKSIHSSVFRAPSTYEHIMHPHIFFTSGRSTTFVAALCCSMTSCPYRTEAHTNMKILKLFLDKKNVHLPATYFTRNAGDIDTS
jgi:type III secretory pathway component EscT